MLQVHTALFVLPDNVRDIDRDKNVGFLIREANQREHDGHELGFVGSALLFGAGRGGGEEVVGWGVRAGRSWVSFVATFLKGVCLVDESLDGRERH